MFKEAENIKGRVVCFLDFNGDLKMDLLMFDGSEITLLVSKLGKYELSYSLKATYEDFICSDFTQDGKVDFLGITSSLEHVLYKQQDGAFIKHQETLKQTNIPSIVKKHVTKHQLPEKFIKTHPFIADIDGKLIPNILGFNSEGLIQATFEDTQFIYKQLTFLQNCEPLNPHSNAFIDLNGDCLAGTKN
jgi:hypothetical protein